jgi:hypothetical protein
MTVSRKEYMEDLLKDCDLAVFDFYGDTVEKNEAQTVAKGQIIAALILADAINGLRKTILMTKGTCNESRT